LAAPRLFGSPAGGAKVQRQDGFLAPNIRETVALVRARFPKWFALLERCNRTAMTLLNKLEPPDGDNQKLVEATLYGRALQSLQAAIILAERGMAADSRACLRRSADTAIFQLKMANDATFDDALIENHDYYRRNLANATLADKEACKHIDTEALDALRAAVAEVNAKYVAPHPKKIIVADIAASVPGGNAIYNTVYRLTSNDAEHTSIASLGRHFEQRPDGSHRMRFGPQLEDIRDTLSSLVNVYLFVLVTAATSYDVSELETEVNELHEAYKRMLRADGHRV
jgi:hypothetical protein